MDNRFKEQRGFLTFAQNNSTTDYLRLAYCQALSIKATQKINSCAVIVDEETNKTVTETHRKVFDHIIVLNDDDAANDEWKLKNEWKAWWITPYKETLKVESDILFTTNIDHWWVGMQQRELVLTSHVRDYEGSVATSRTYRKLFDDNLLPDVYNGIMYFRYGKTSMDFFIMARDIFQNWPMFRDELLINCRDEEPSTDVVFAIAAELVGANLCTLPSLSYPTFTHMKSAMQGWGTGVDWEETLYAQFDKEQLTVGFTRQLYPFHYQTKTFITDDTIKHYEQLNGF
jgi:hypothetical protein